ncbi:MAG: SGNH/GDSL hydrolase family protein [Actinomycetota bacterium]
MASSVRFLILPLILFALLAMPGSAALRSYPSAIAGLGDSITQAANTCCKPGNYPAKSWSTGDGPADGIRSHYERLKALHPQSSISSHNDSAGGAEAADLPAQTFMAVAQKADYITLLIGANDLCASTASAMTSTADFSKHVATALEALHHGLPRAHIYVSSIPDLHRLWSVLRTDQEARRVWAADGTCPSMLGAEVTENQRRKVVARERAFNEILADTCARYRNCHWDRGAVYAYKFSATEISTLDYFHPGPGGQAALAELTWQAFQGHR